MAAKDPASTADAPNTSFYKPMKRKQRVIFILCTIVVTFTLWLSLSNSTSSYQPSAIVSPPPTRRADHIVLAEPVLGDNHLIFIESSCMDATFHPLDRGILLNPRQACSIESAARNNPLSRIYLLYTCPIQEDAYETSREFVRRVFSYPNVRLWTLDIAEYFQRTPLETFYKMGLWTKTNWPKQHSSDVLRFLTLWKYGGTYLDLDMVVRRPFNELGVNFAGAESSTLLGTSVLNFASDTIGQEVAKQCLTELNTDFRGYEWIYNGPGLITRVMGRFCNLTQYVQHLKLIQRLFWGGQAPTVQTSEMTPARCSGFKVFQTPVFFPVLYEDDELPLLFDEERSEETMERMENSYAVHMWNKLSYDQIVRVGSRQPYGLLAQEFCPEVYHNCGKIF